MIHEVSGDILFSKAQVIAHGVAPNDPMTQGLARALHEKFPAMHKDFHHWCSQRHPAPGQIWMWGGAGGTRIVSLSGHVKKPGYYEIEVGKVTLGELINHPDFGGGLLDALEVRAGLEGVEVWGVRSQR